MGKIFIVNAPLVFTSVFGIIKGWLDEPTRRKISICGSNYQSQLWQYADRDSIPECLGGTNTANWTDDLGPWNDYSAEDGGTLDTIGVRRIDDPNAKLFGPREMLKLENPLVTGKGTWGTNGAVIL